MIYHDYLANSPMVHQLGLLFTPGSRSRLGGGEVGRRLHRPDAGGGGAGTTAGGADAADAMMAPLVL